MSLSEEFLLIGNKDTPLYPGIRFCKTLLLIANKQILGINILNTPSKDKLLRFEVVLCSSVLIYRRQLNGVLCINLFGFSALYGCGMLAIQVLNI